MVTALLSLAVSTGLQAADNFVVFESAEKTWQLKDLTISIVDGEHKLCEDCRAVRP